MRLRRRQAGLHHEITTRRRLHQRLAVSGRKPHKLGHVLAQELPARVEPFAELIEHGFDAAADPFACFKHNEVDVLPCKFERRREAGEACADDNHLMIAARCAQYPTLIFSNSAIIFSFSSFGNSVLSTNFWRSG
jgi:hypothetical protein